MGSVVARGPGVTYAGYINGSNNGALAYDHDLSLLLKAITVIPLLFVLFFVLFFVMPLERKEDNRLPHKTFHCYIEG